MAFTVEEIEAVQDLILSGATVRKIIKQTGISKNRVYGILNGSKRDSLWRRKPLPVGGGALYDFTDE